MRQRDDLPDFEADVLPALEKGLGPGMAAALARTARMLRDDADALPGREQADLELHREHPGPRRHEGQGRAAAGAAALLAPGTSLCQATDVFQLMRVAGYQPV